MATIRLGFHYEEFYPVFILSEGPTPSSDTVDVDKRFYNRYKRVMKAFNDLQDELDEIDPIRKRIRT